MSATTSIEWTDRTWNPVTGCTKVSPGCKNCYAEGVAERFWATQYPKNADGSARKFTDVRCHPERLDEPLHWKKPSRVFVNSMSDLFHEDVPNQFVDQVFAVMALAKEHMFQVLTKRPERMCDYLLAIQDDDKDMQRWASAAPEKHPCSCSYIEDREWPLSNVLIGVSVENRATADERIPLLLATPAAVRFLSVEPLLEFVDVHPWLSGIERRADAKIDWVIVGGESGSKARLCGVDWIRTVMAQCKGAKVPVFVKQLGSNSDWRVPNEWLAFSGAAAVKCAHGFDACPRCDGGTSPMVDRKGGDINEWPEDLRVREFPNP